MLHYNGSNTAQIGCPKEKTSTEAWSNPELGHAGEVATGEEVVDRPGIGFPCTHSASCMSAKSVTVVRKGLELVVGLGGPV